MQSLVTIEKIEKIEPLEGSKTLEVLSFAEQGWKAFAPKGKFIPGGLCVFALAGTFFPNLESGVHSELGYIRDMFSSRVKTLKVCNKYSNGYAMTTNVLPEDCSIFVGRDVTDILKATSWDPSPEIHHTYAKGPLPSWIPNEREKLLQANIRTLRMLGNQKFYAVEKFNGMSAIFYYSSAVGGRDSFGVCSKNLEFSLSKDHPLVLWAKRNNIRDKMKTMCQDSGLFEREGPYPSIWLRGEFVSPQSNRNYYRNTEEECYFHTLGAYPFGPANILSRGWMEKLLSENRLRASPIVAQLVYLTNQTMENQFRTFFRRLPKIGHKLSPPKINIENLVQLATVKSSLNEKVEAKGVILKPISSPSRDNFLLEEKGKTFTIQNPEFNLRTNQ